MGLFVERHQPRLFSFQRHLAVLQPVFGCRKVCSRVRKVLPGTLEVVVVSVLFDGSARIRQSERANGLARRLQRMGTAFEKINVIIINSSLHSIKEFLPVLQIIAY